MVAKYVVVMAFMGYSLDIGTLAEFDFQLLQYHRQFSLFSYCDIIDAGLCTLPFLSFFAEFYYQKQREQIARTNGAC